MATTSESSPLLPTHNAPSVAAAPPRPQRTVTFNPDPTVLNNPRSTRSVSNTIPSQNAGTASGTSTAPQPMLSALNSKLRRRNSQGAPLINNNTVAPKIGPQRTTRTAQKLKLLPNPELGEDGPDEESGRDVYSQFTRIKDPTARRDAARLGKADRERLPRVTAYCTASAYRLDALMKFLKGRGRQRAALPKQFDECIYTPYSYTSTSSTSPHRASKSSLSRDDAPELSRSASEGTDIPTLNTEASSEPSRPLSPSPSRPRRQSDSAIEIDEHMSLRRETLIDLASNTPTANGLLTETISQDADLDTQVHTPEVFLFEYGTVVIWGMTISQEKRFLSEITKFEKEKLPLEDVQVENFNFYYTREYQARIYNDFISLRDRKNYMTKLAISHALSQSVKTSLFEDLLSESIAQTTPLPALLARTGKIALSSKEINSKIGELFILRINIHLQGSVLDSPELMWAEPQLEPVYGAMRSYLEMDQRVGLLNERMGVLGDLLAVLKDQVGTRHGEYLEWIVIILIAAEILVAAINILVDLYAGVD